MKYLWSDVFSVCFCLIQKAEVELTELRSGKEQAQKEQQTLKKQISELEMKTKELNRLLDSEKQG